MSQECDYSNWNNTHNIILLWLLVHYYLILAQLSSYEILQGYSFPSVFIKRSATYIVPTCCQYNQDICRDTITPTTRSSSFISGEKTAPRVRKQRTSSLTYGGNIYLLEYYKVWFYIVVFFCYCKVPHDQILPKVNSPAVLWGRLLKIQLANPLK